MERKPGVAPTALEFAYDRYLGEDKVEALEAELAKLVGTSASMIRRLEDADYEGHSLAMLRRIAAAMNKRVEIRFMPVKGTASSTS